MAAYSPPTGTVNLDLAGSYSPPVGQVDLDLTDIRAVDRRLAGAALAVSVGAGQFVAPRPVRGAALALAVGHGAVIAANPVRGAALALAVGHGAGRFDPDLLSAVHAVAGAAWRSAEPAPFGSPAAWRDAEPAPVAVSARWGAADSRPGAAIERWRVAGRLTGAGIDRWRNAEALAGFGAEAWRQGAFAAGAGIERWRDADRRTADASAVWIMTLPRLAPEWRLPWSQGELLPTSLADRFGDGGFLISHEIERWRQAGYPANAPNPGPPPPPDDPDYKPPVGVVDLDLRCPLPVSPGPVNLNLGRSPCPLWPAVNVPVLKVYRVLNSCSLVRLPDRAPLAVTAITVETDADSWCWALSATLAGPAGWTLLQPQPPAFLPVEVEATINGHVWRFLLDAPSASRKFNQSQQSLKGRSRSAWLADPFTAPSSGVEANPRTAQQLAEQALENLGWTLVWLLPADWLVPAGLHAWNGTPIDQLIGLVTPVDGCLYTDPSAAVITAYPRYPTAGWLWDGQTADVGIPEAAVLSLERSPENRPVLNGCYVSGTLHGYTAWVKIAGTDGALTPAEPIVDPLLCHADALRARGIAVLSAAGPGHVLSAGLLLTAEGGTGPGLLRPGLLAEIAGVRGMVRSVRVSAYWSMGLQVRQQVGIERREVEA